MAKKLIEPKEVLQEQLDNLRNEYRKNSKASSDLFEKINGIEREIKALEEKEQKAAIDQGRRDLIITQLHMGYMYIDPNDKTPVPDYSLDYIRAFINGLPQKDFELIEKLVHNQLMLEKENRALQNELKDTKNELKVKLNSLYGKDVSTADRCYVRYEHK